MIEHVALGEQGLLVARMALGCMGMSEFYPGGSETESAATIAAAVDAGITMLDTADMYGPFTNEELVGACVHHRRSSVVLATKFGYVRHPDGTRLGLNGRPDYVRHACAASLRRLRTDYIDIYYLHRVDSAVPIEDTVGAMSLLVKEGKIRFLGLSEVSASTLRRALATAPISVVQTEYSLLSRDPEADLFGTLRELNVGFVAYAPLGRGLLTNTILRAEDLPGDDYRLCTPRFSCENLSHNVATVAQLGAVARDLGIAPTLIALAWVRQRIGDGVVLMGTKHRTRLAQNLTSLAVVLSDETMALLDVMFPPNVARGARYPDMSRVNR